MAKLTTRQFAKRLKKLTAKEVLSRCQSGDIKAEKFGWVWAIDESQVEEVKNSEWYKRHLANV